MIGLPGAIGSGVVPVAAQNVSGQTAQAEGQASAQAASATPSWRANEDDFLFLQMTIENYRLTQDVRGYQTIGGVCLDLADVIQSLDLPIRIDKQSRRATGWLFAEDQRFTLDRDQGSVHSGDRGSAPLAQEIYDTPEGWCVDVKALSRWFGIDFKPDLFNSAVRLESERDLPFMQAIERRSRAARLRGRRTAQFDLSKYPNEEMEYRSWRTPSVDLVASTGVESGPRTRSGIRGRVEAYAAGEALGASYFVRVASNDSLEPETIRARVYRNDPQGKMLGPLAATQVAVGDVQTVAGRLTGQSSVGRGAFVSNRPLGQSSRFSSTTLRGALPAGWDAELYRNGQLLAFQDDRGDGRYEFVDVELFFGRNELEVVLYGPQGQVRKETTNVPVGFNQIEPGKTYYWAGALQDNQDLVDIGKTKLPGPHKWRWGMGVERGLDARTSAAIGVQSLYFAGKRRRYVEGSLVRSFGSLQVEWSTAHEWGAGVAMETRALSRWGRFNLGVNVQKVFGNFASEFVDEQIDYRGGFNFDTSLKLGKFQLPIQGLIEHSRLKDGGRINEVQLGTAVSLGRAALAVQLSHQQSSATIDRAARRETRVQLLGNARFKTFRLRGNATFLATGPDKGLESATIRLDTDIGDRAELVGEAEYDARNDEYRLTAGYTHRFDTLALRGDAFVTSRGAVGAGVQLAFSLGPDPVDGGLRVTRTKLARSGQAAVTVFRDDNGNSRRDEGEELLPNVLVEAGLRGTDAYTGENGRTIVDELRPFQPVLVGIDESSLDDPFLAPKEKGIVITPRPGVIAEIELAISPTGEVEGELLNSSGVMQPGVRLELLNEQGAVAAQTISEFDGFFLFQRVPYGRYRLRIAESAARSLGVLPDLTMSDGRSEFTLGRGEDVIRFGPLRMRLGPQNGVPQQGIPHEPPPPDPPATIAAISPANRVNPD